MILDVRKWMVGAAMDRDLDWPVIIMKLGKNGINQAEICRRTGIAAGTLSTVKQETKNPPAGWNEAINLLDLYIKAVGTQVPRIGEYYEDEISIT